MYYHIFRKSRISKNNKNILSWYYWYYDPKTGKQIQFVCKNCHNKSEAEAYISTLPIPDQLRKIVTIHQIVKDMYVPGSKHFERIIQYGKQIAPETVQFNRHYMILFDTLWGTLDIREITAPLIDEYLLTDTHSGSWKNSFIEKMNEVIREAPWYGINLTPPMFHRFVRNSRKPDVFTTSDLNKLFIPENFPSYDFYLFFRTAVSGGLRLGEVRALRPCQIIEQKNALIIDGFCKKDGTRTNYNKTGSDSKPKFRVTKLPEDIIELLTEYIRTNHILPDDFIFTKDIKPFSQTYCRTVLKRAIKLSGIKTIGKKFVPHSCRYTYVTRMRRNLPANVVQNLAGHSTVEMTEEYNRAALPYLIESVDSMEITRSANHLFE